MKIVGKNTNGNFIVADMAHLYFQEGLPPSLIFDLCKTIGVIPSFIHFYDELRDNGMKHDRVIHLLSEHVFESYGKEYRDVVIGRLQLNINKS